MEALYARTLTALGLDQEQQQQQEERGAIGSSGRTNGTAPLGYAMRFEAAARGVGAYLRVRLLACVSIGWGEGGKRTMDRPFGLISPCPPPHTTLTHGINSKLMERDNRRCGGRGGRSDGC